MKVKRPKKPVGRKGLKGREAAAPAAEPPKSPVFAEQKCAQIDSFHFGTRYSII
jgi:hypothetical protein